MLGIGRSRYAAGCPRHHPAAFLLWGQGRPDTYQFSPRDFRLAGPAGKRVRRLKSLPHFSDAYSLFCMPHISSRPCVSTWRADREASVRRTRSRSRRGSRSSSLLARSATWTRELIKQLVQRDELTSPDLFAPAPDRSHFGICASDDWRTFL